MIDEAMALEAALEASWLNGFVAGFVVAVILAAFGVGLFTRWALRVQARRRGG